MRVAPSVVECLRTFKRLLKVVGLINILISILYVNVVYFVGKKSVLLLAFHIYWGGTNITDVNVPPSTSLITFSIGQARTS